ncbi:hypothetical protein RB25_12960 [Herbaspirillum rubrisubalbicans]|uniref:Lipoprotein n=1 Tax=Herbaspirillum rubrisubalbicans TaxID=80842 RepID=A0ABX9C3I4_9BURK|nr:hypothetical protein [Herbaspirillum rubrisubalbicans]MCP1573452.1 hypothetical protein [Herbaspirillum rubrisubalbicans]NQE47750.1 hypothetical protein [Herbaspirillum rubrisubalbicans]RAM65088.1 hypothetical protein RB24_08950 [Herbaspirillum rubrisubalbicans]RAN48265.1 hypothetical protein RB25_12960 [Herbaspirillum rubrisubalbicans]
MSSNDRTVSSHFPWLLLVSLMVSACTAPNFRFRDTAQGLSEIVQEVGKERCDGKIDYADYRDCNRTVNTKYETWGAERKRQQERDAFKIPPVGR